MLYVNNCTNNGLEHVWNESVSDGEFQGWGKGSMAMRCCGNCQEVEYIRFTSKKGATTDIRKMIDDAAKRGVYSMGSSEIGVKRDEKSEGQEARLDGRPQGWR